MAKLPLEITETINQLKQQSLDIVEQATALEFGIFEIFGETQATISYMDEMKNVGNEGADSFSQLSTLQLQIAQAQPMATRDMLDLLDRAIVRVKTRIPALERSIQEVKMEWKLL